MQVTATLTLVMALVLGTLLTACASPGSGGGGDGDADGGGAGTSVQYGDTLDLGVPGEVLATVPEVAYYPACRNEVLELDGRTWYPFTPANLDDLPTAVAMAATASAGSGTGGGTTSAELPAAVPPGPGDDVGTLEIYEGGFAHFRSDSGRLETWLTDRELEYLWMC